MSERGKYGGRRENKFDYARRMEEVPSELPLDLESTEVRPETIETSILEGQSQEMRIHNGERGLDPEIVHNGVSLPEEGIVETQSQAETTDATDAADAIFDDVANSVRDRGLQTWDVEHSFGKIIQARKKVHGLAEEYKSATDNRKAEIELEADTILRDMRNRLKRGVHRSVDRVIKGREERAQREAEIQTQPRVEQDAVALPEMQTMPEPTPAEELPGAEMLPKERREHYHNELEKLLTKLNADQRPDKFMFEQQEETPTENPSEILKTQEGLRVMTADDMPQETVRAAEPAVSSVEVQHSDILESAREALRSPEAEKALSFLEGRKTTWNEKLKNLGAGILTGVRNEWAGVQSDVKTLLNPSEMGARVGALFNRAKEYFSTYDRTRYTYKEMFKMFVGDLGKLADSYQKLAPRHKMYIAGGLIFGASFTSISVPLLSGALKGGIFAQRALSATGLMRKKSADLRAKVDAGEKLVTGNEEWQRNARVVGTTVLYTATAGFVSLEAIKVLNDMGVNKWMGWLGQMLDHGPTVEAAVVTADPLSVAVEPMPTPMPSPQEIDFSMFMSGQDSMVGDHTISMHAVADSGIPKPPMPEWTPENEPHLIPMHETPAPHVEVPIPDVPPLAAEGSSVDLQNPPDQSIAAVPISDGGVSLENAPDLQVLKPSEIAPPPEPLSVAPTVDAADVIENRIPAVPVESAVPEPSAPIEVTTTPASVEPSPVQDMGEVDSAPLPPQAEAATPGTQELFTNKFGLPINAGEPHIYAGEDGTLFAYGGESAERSSLMMQYLRDHPGATIFATDNDGKFRVPVTLNDQGEFSVGNAVTEKNMFSWLFGETNAKPPSPDMFLKILS